MTDDRHLSEETVNEMVDGALPAHRRAEAEQHLAACERCRRETARLRALLQRAGALPRRAEPPGDLWAGIAREMRGPRVLALESRAGDRRPRWAAVSRLAAAGLVLASLSAATTALILRRDRTATVAVGAAVVPDAPPVALAEFRRVEAGHVRAADELQEAVNARRSQLMPETVATVERSLAVIDTAISEARDALERDPGNRTLVDMLSAHYERKVDLLKRTTDLLPRS